MRGAVEIFRWSTNRSIAHVVELTRAQVSCPQNIVLSFFWTWLAVEDPENVDADVAVRAGEPAPVGVDGHEVTVGDDAKNLTLGVGKRCQEGLDVRPQTLDAIFGGGSVLDVGVADVAGDRTIDVTVEVRLLVDGRGDLLFTSS